jgi:hypothetical protein
MATQPNYFVGAVVMTISLLLLVTFYKTSGTLSASHYSQGNSSRDLPVVDYEIEVSRPKSKERKEKDNHFKGRGNPDSRRPIAELPEGVEPLPINGAWWLGLSALPIDQSDVVVLGIIGAREAHLSDDKTGIYSEFTVLVADILKDGTKTIIPGNVVSASRPGGWVRFKSGKIQKYELSRQGMPQVGAQYALFLRKTADGDLLILTGYELSDGHITPLDGEEDKDPRMVLPFAKYRGVDQANFLKDIREAAARSVIGGVH